MITCDINAFTPPEPGTFDRVVSIEMMEHVKNYEVLLGRVASWLRRGGKMFVHIFTHKSLPFHYTDGWMTENFFSGGQVRAGREGGMEGGEQGQRTVPSAK